MPFRMDWIGDEHLAKHPKANMVDQQYQDNVKDLIAFNSVLGNPSRGVARHRRNPLPPPPPPCGAAT